MNKQKAHKYRIRKLNKRVKGSVMFNDFNQSASLMLERFSGDGKTEMKEENVEEQGAGDMRDLEKSLEIPHLRERKDQEEQRIHQQNEPVEGNELPKIEEIQSNPEIKQDVLEKEQKNNEEKIEEMQQQKIVIEPQQMKIYNVFSTTLKSQTIQIDSCSTATQKGSYWQNKKLVLTEPIQQSQAKAIFVVNNLKYCIGMGIALKQIIQKHDFDYKSYENQLSHGLFLITSQGYSWSHAYKLEDDIFRQGFNKMKNDDQVEVMLQYTRVTFTYKQSRFQLYIPQGTLKKYTLCFCAYLHQKSDSLRLESSQTNSQEPSI